MLISQQFNVGSSNIEKQAEIDLLEAVESLLCTSDNCLLSIASKLDSCVETLLNDCDSCIKKVLRKLTRAVDKCQSQPANEIDNILTRIRICLDQGMDVTHLTLQQAAVKCGAILIGQDLSVVIDPTSPLDIGPQFGGTLILSIKEAVPFLECICDVLKEIRNLLPKPVSITATTVADNGTISTVSVGKFNDVPGSTLETMG